MKSVLLRKAFTLVSLLFLIGEAGAQVALPYSQRFNDVSDFETFTVADENNDQQTWRYDDILQTAKCARDYDADDWLITPIFELEGGKTYSLSFKTYIEMSGTEELSVFLGTSKRVSSFVTSLMPATGISNITPQTMTVIFEVDESDDYRIGFHFSTVNDPFSNYIYLDDLYLEETTSRSAPQPVTDLTVVPGEEGALSASVSLRAPEQMVNGQPLEELTKVVVYRDNLIVHTFEAPAPGEQLSFEDNGGIYNGKHTYSAIASNNQGPSDPAEVTVFIGHDMPGPVENLHFEYDYDTHHAVITWDAPSVGANGGYIDPAELKYSLRKYPLTSDKTITDPISETIFEDDVDVQWLDSVAEARYKEVEEQYHYPVARTIVIDGQGLMHYMVKAISDYGVGEETQSESRIIGEPYTLPFEESFANGFCTHFWYKPVTPGRSRWYEMSDNRFTQDGDSGFLAFTASVVDESSAGFEETTRAQTGRLCFTDCNSPVISLYYLYAYAMPRPLKVNVSTDGQNFTTVAELDMSNEAMAGQYIRAVVPLSAIAGESSWYVAVEATLANTT